MAFLSCEEMLAAARSQKITLAEAVLRSDLEESRLTEAHSRAAMRHLWQVMQATSQEYDPAQRSRSVRMRTIWNCRKRGMRFLRRSAMHSAIFWNWRNPRLPKKPGN